MTASKTTSGRCFDRTRQASITEIGNSENPIDRSTRDLPFNPVT